MSETIKIFILHTSSDSKLADKLEDSLHLLLNSTSQGYVHRILRGDKTSTGEISQSLATSKIYESHIVLLLITKDFIVSDYNYELADFIKRLHANHQIVAIPIIGERCNFADSAYKNLQVLPNQNHFETITTGNTVGAIKNVAEGIQNVMNKVNPIDVSETIYDRETILSELRSLISQNKIKQVFERVDEIVSSTKDNNRLETELVLLQSRYNKAERDARVGIVSAENESVARNRLIESLLAFIDDIPEEFFHQDIENIESYLDSKNKVLSYDISNDYYDEIKEEVVTRGLIETKNLNEIKLILIGNGGVGKTTLRKNLVNNNYGITQHESTVGIEVVPCLTKDTEYGDVLMNIWDFGGQGKYRAIQHFFCSHNSFYLFVTQPTELEKDEDDSYGGFHYWLSFISAFGYDKTTGKDSPVIYVMNKADLLVEEIDLNKIQKEFGNIRNAINISCKNTENIQNLAEMIFEYLGETNMVGRTFSQKWLEVKEQLAKMDKKYISKKEYEELCNDNGLLEEERQNALLQYLIAVGTILYFPATINLINRIILDPNWIRQLAYQIIDLDCIQRGHLEIEDINKSELKIENVIVALDVLLKFELCYKITKSGKDCYIFPNLFPKIKKHEKVKLGNFENYPYKYECIFGPFIPASVFHKIIVRLHNMITDVNNCWKEIVVLHKDEVKIVFREDWETNKLELFLKGDEVNTKIQLISIRTEIELICHTIMSQKFLRNFTLKEKIITPNGEMNLQQILKNKGGVVIENIVVKGGTLQVADKIENHNSAESAINEFLNR